MTFIELAPACAQMYHSFFVYFCRQSLDISNPYSIKHILSSSTVRRSTCPRWNRKSPTRSSRSWRTVRAPSHFSWRSVELLGVRPYLTWRIIRLIHWRGRNSCHDMWVSSVALLILFSIKLRPLCPGAAADIPVYMYGHWRLHGDLNFPPTKAPSPLYIHSVSDLADNAVNPLEKQQLLSCACFGHRPFETLVIRIYL